MGETFFAILSRMKYIERWALMRNARAETLSEHSLEVAMIAHALCVIGNVRYGKALQAERAAVVGLFHDASEIVTGDMPTPVKYGNEEIREAYHAVEAQAERRLLSALPEDLQPVYREILGSDPAERDFADSDLAGYERRLVKAADKLSALIKCIEEENSGNREFRTAKETTRRAVSKLAKELPEVADFVQEFLPFYGSTLDELLGRGDEAAVK